MRDARRDDMGMVYLTVLGIAVVGSYVLWRSMHDDIVYYSLLWCWYQLAPFDWSFSPSFIRAWRLEAAQLAAAPATVSFDQMVGMLNKVAYFYIWLPVWMAINGIKRAVKHPALVTRREITVDNLPEIMSHHSPAIIPSLYYGDPKNDLLLNADPPEHRRSQNPEEWVAEHGLLINRQLDRERCRKLLIEQLGQPITDIDQLSDCERALFTVFGARLFSDEHHVAQNLLDELNRSCHNHTWEGKKGYPDLSIPNKYFRRFCKHPAVSEWLQKHPYPRTLLHAMHEQAMKSGKLPNAHFRWLKGMDRSLWYVLTTTGRKVAFIESAAVYTQCQWEKFVFELGYRLKQPYVDDAIDGLETYLISVGLVPPNQRTKNEN